MVQVFKQIAPIFTIFVLLVERIDVLTKKYDRLPSFYVI